MDIHLPPEIAHYEGELRYFIDTMIRKLHTNRHKGFAENVHPISLFNGAQTEMAELRDALLHKDQFAAFVEAADVANMSFLTGLAAIRMTRADFDKGKEVKTDERIHPDNADRRQTNATIKSTFDDPTMGGDPNTQ